MKTRFLPTALMVFFVLGAMAQKPSITLTFTADNNGQYVPLDSILIENLTQDVDTTLYAPDTALTLDYITAMEEINSLRGNDFSHFYSYPNPMIGKTTVSLWLPERNNILFMINDVVGREVASQHFQLEKGTHTFCFYPGKESLYFLTARAGEQSRTIKMFNSRSAASVTGLCKLEYNGIKTGSDGNKAGIALSNFVFELGDQLQFTSYSMLGDLTISDIPAESQAYIFQYTSGGIPCPGMPTVTDSDGNVYNTILIGDQCWMKENLKSTSYQNGTPIPNVTDNSEWENLTTGAYAWHDNDISWKDKYGALYNWFVVATGVCPEGWHLPSHDDWIVLTDYIGGKNEPYGDKLKSCRQVYSPIGGACNTNVHPRWDQHNKYYGTDNYGFSGLPGGSRSIYGNFYFFVGQYGYWWSSTESTEEDAWARFLLRDGGHVGDIQLEKRHGLSIRCLRDY